VRTHPPRPRPQPWHVASVGAVSFPGNTRAEALGVPSRRAAKTAVGSGDRASERAREGRRAMPGRLVSGGQAGVDRAGCPASWTEAGPDRVGLRRALAIRGLRLRQRHGLNSIRRHNV
jgi:hypothetical protein